MTDEHSEKIQKLETQLEKATNIVSDLNFVINESHGVSGYARNGDMTLWTDLIEDG